MSNCLGTAPKSFSAGSSVRDAVNGWAKSGKVLAVASAYSSIHSSTLPPRLAHNSVSRDDNLSPQFPPDAFDSSDGKQSAEQSPATNALEAAWQEGVHGAYGESDSVLDNQADERKGPKHKAAIGGESDARLCSLDAPSLVTTLCGGYGLNTKKVALLDTQQLDVLLEAGHVFSVHLLQHAALGADARLLAWMRANASPRVYWSTDAVLNHLLRVFSSTKTIDVPLPRLEACLDVVFDDVKDKATFPLVAFLRRCLRTSSSSLKRLRWLLDVAACRYPLPLRFADISEERFVIQCTKRLHKVGYRLLADKLETIVQARRIVPRPQPDVDGKLDGPYQCVHILEDSGRDRVQWVFLPSPTTTVASVDALTQQVRNVLTTHGVDKKKIVLYDLLRHLEARELVALLRAGYPLPPKVVAPLWTTNSTRCCRPATRLERIFSTTQHKQKAHMRSRG